MKLIFVVLAITVGCAFGDDADDVKCLQEKLTPCAAGIYASIAPKLHAGEKIKPCSVIPDAVKCLRDSVKACNVKLNFDDLTNTFTDACKEGSDLFNKLTANEDCIAKQKDSVSSCVKVKNIAEYTPEQELEVQKDVCSCNSSNGPSWALIYLTKQSPHEVPLCISGIYSIKQLDSIPPCVAKKVEKACGKDAGEVTQKLISPLLKIAQPVCAEILKGAATSLFVSSYSIFFALAVVLFVWMKQ